MEHERQIELDSAITVLMQVILWTHYAKDKEQETAITITPDDAKFLSEHANVGFAWLKGLDVK